MKVQNQANRRSTNNERKQAKQKYHRNFFLSLFITKFIHSRISKSIYEIKILRPPHYEGDTDSRLSVRLRYRTCQTLQRLYPLSRSLPRRPECQPESGFSAKPVDDYGTSQGGSIIDLVMWIKGCSAYEAMTHLAEGKVITLAPSFFHHATTTTATNLTMKGKEAALCLVLNSVSNLPRAISYLYENGIDSVRAFLDNDDAGQKALQALQSARINVEDMSRQYGYKDFNEYHVVQCSKRQEKQARPPRKRGRRR